MRKMVKCLYCKKDIGENVNFYVCDSCGVGVWGRKMFDAIKNNMQNMDETKE